MAVRNEVVRLSLQDDFTTPMAKAAAAAALLNRELNSLSGSAVSSSRASRTIAQDNDTIARSANKADSSINQLTGRLRLFADLAAILGPALLPIGAVAVPAITGLANQLGVAALAGGTAIIAFQGVGDALSAVNKAAIEPTDANLEKVRQTLENLGPAAREMVVRLNDLRPVLKDLRDTAAEGLFPGVIESLDSLERRVPDVERILANMSTTLGEIVADSGESLASDRWDEFFDFLATDATDSLVSLGHTVGDLTHGLAELWMAFDPLNDDFSGWLQGVASGFDSWASGLAQTEGFREFIDYVRSTGPQVAETFGALAGMLVQIGQAAAPLGGPVLQGLESIAKVIGAIADSDLGTPIMAGVLAMALLSRATRSYQAIAATAFGQRFGGMISGLTTVTSAQDRARTSAASLATQAHATDRALSGMGAGLAILGAIEGINLLDAALDNLANRDLDTSTLGRSLEALSSGDVMGTLADVWGGDLGGLNKDLDTLDNNLSRITDFPDKILPGDLSQTQQAESNIAKLDEALAGLVESGQGDQAAAIFDQLVEAAEKGGNSASQLAERLSEYDIALRNTGQSSSFLDSMMTGLLPTMTGIRGAAEGGADGTRTMRQAMRAMGLDAGPTAERLKELQTALEQSRKDAAGVANQFFNLGDGLDDAKVSLAEWIRSLERQAAALRDFRINAQQAAKKGLDDGLIKSLQEAGAAGALRMKQLANATESEITRANGAWRRGQREVERYIDSTVKVPKQLTTDVSVDGVPKAHNDLNGVKRGMSEVDRARAHPVVDVNGSPAFAAIEGIKTALRNIPDEQVNVYVNRRGGVTSSAGGRSVDAPAADGATVPKTGLPYADRHHYLLADGEEVISNRYGQADRHRQLLKAINANAMADGGTVRVGSGAPSVNVSSGPVSVGGARVQVFIDGREVRATMRSEIEADRRYRDRLDDRD